MPSHELSREEIENSLRPAIANMMRAADLFDQGVELPEDQLKNNPSKPTGLIINRSLRRYFASNRSISTRFVTIFYDLVGLELDVKLSSIKKNMELDGMSPHSVLKACGFVGRIMDSVMQQSEQLESNGTSNTSNSGKPKKIPPAIEPVISKLAGFLYTIHSVVGDFDKVKVALDQFEKLSPRVAQNCLHNIVSSQNIDSSGDQGLLNYFTSRFNVFLIEDAGKTRDIFGKIIIDATENLTELNKLAPVIKIVSEKIPSLSMTEVVKTTALVKEMDFYVDLVSDGDPKAFNVYRLPIMHNMMVLINASADFAREMFDAVYPTGARVHYDALKICAELLPLINVKSPPLATHMFRYLAGQKELEPGEKTLLRENGLKLFSENAASRPDEALTVWQTMLQLAKGERQPIRSLVNEAFPSAQAAFPRNAPFARAFLTAIDEACAGKTDLHFGVAGSEMVLAQKTFGFIVVTERNEVALDNGVQKAVFGPAYSILGDAIKAKGEHIRDAMPLVEFVTQVQDDMLKRRKPAAGSNASVPAPLKQAVLAKLEA